MKLTIVVGMLFRAAIRQSSHTSLPPIIKSLHSSCCHLKVVSSPSSTRTATSKLTNALTLSLLLSPIVHGAQRTTDVLKDSDSSATADRMMAMKDKALIVSRMGFRCLSPHEVPTSPRPRQNKLLSHKLRTLRSSQHIGSGSSISL